MNLLHMVASPGILAPDTGTFRIDGMQGSVVAQLEGSDGRQQACRERRMELRRYRNDGESSEARCKSNEYHTAIARMA